MYNRYIPNGASYTRVRVEEPVESQPPAHPRQRNRIRRPAPGTNAPSTPAAPVRAEPQASPSPSFLTGERGSGGLGGLLKALKLEDLDSGDLLLLLIVLLLLWEGDDLELVIALGLVLILGLGDKEMEP